MPIENTRVYHGTSESSQDIALAGALLSRLPEWPRWERLGDVQATLAIYSCALCGQRITDGKPCGCGAR
jgi:hypothetical protein